MQRGFGGSSAHRRKAEEVVYCVVERRGFYLYLKRIELFMRRLGNPNHFVVLHSYHT